MWNTGPSLKTNSFLDWSKMDVPVMSEGSRSEVNWILAKERSMVLARDRAKVVFPTPGTSSMRRCPSARKQVRA